MAIKKTKHGLAFTGEQGIESVHAQFNTLKRSFHGIRNDKDRLLATLREHHLKTSPQIHVEAPVPKKRKL